MSSVRTKQVTLPSGAVVTFRPLKTEELNLLAKVSNGGKRVNSERYDGLVKVLQNCTLSVQNHGPFESFTWQKTTDADQMVGIFALRVLSYGSTLPGVRMACEECDHRWPADVNLSPTEEGGLLRVFPMSVDGRAALSGNCLLPAYTLPSGTKVVCRILAGEHRKHAIKILEELSDDPIIAGLRARMARITMPDGTEVEENDLTDAVRNLDASDLPDLQDFLADTDGGVDDTVDIECPKCGHENEERSSPFVVARGFWGLSRKTRKRR